AATLKRERWIPLPQLVAIPGEQDLGAASGIFYAESWALADMLALSHDYAPRFPHFVAELNGGANSERAFAKIYGKSLDEIARDLWNRAIQGGVGDAVLCFRYAMLASNAGVAPDEVRPVLRRAIELKPEFDDARFMLGLLESNAGNAADAVAQLRAVRHVTAS